MNTTKPWANTYYNFQKRTSCRNFQLMKSWDYSAAFSWWTLSLSITSKHLFSVSITKSWFHWKKNWIWARGWPSSKRADKVSRAASSNASKKLRMNSRKYTVLICSIQSQGKELTAVWTRVQRPWRGQIATGDLVLFFSTNNSEH
jgi:hypothetical protein